jgi:hypothetical protein
MFLAGQGQPVYWSLAAGQLGEHVQREMAQALGILLSAGGKGRFEARVISALGKPVDLPLFGVQQHAGHGCSAQVQADHVGHLSTLRRVLMARYSRQ